MFQDIFLHSILALRLWKKISTKIAEKKVLIHCDAGRDRSGAVSALLMAMASEKAGLLDERMISAIECDYRKTESLIEEKYGRMSNFIRNLINGGGVNEFLIQQCNVPINIISKASERILSYF